MTRFLTVMALVLCICGLAVAAEPDLTTSDPFAQFWNNVMKYPFQDWGNEDTTWGQMMESVELGGYLRVRYETTEIRSVQRIFGPSPTGPGQTAAVNRLAMVGERWADWVAYKALFTMKLDLTTDIMFYGSLINMNVVGENARFRRTMPANAGTGGARVKSPQIHDPEVTVYEGYMQWNNFVFPGITAKVGRQELVYGNQWLLSNNSFYGGLSYDAAKLSINATEEYSVDFFAGQVNSVYALPGPSRPEICGMYLTYIAAPGIEEGQDTLLDVYVLYNTDHMNAADLGTRADFAKERRYTLGSRLAGHLLPDIDYSLQGAYQIGRTAESVGTTSHADIEAYAAEVEIGKTWTDINWTPRIGLRAGYASGDSNAADGDAEAFNPLYQNPHGMHGLADVFHFTNLVDYAATLTMRPDENWTIGAEGHIFRLAERIPGGSKELGREIDLFAKLQATDTFSVALVWASFDQGKAFRNGTGPHSQRVYLNFEYSF